MFFASNRFRVIPSESERFEQIWLTRESRLHEVPGFIAFHLLKGKQEEDHILYASMTMFESREAFEAWTKSDQFRRSHSSAGSSKPTTIGPPQFEGFETLQTINAPAKAAA
ncbi:MULTISPECIES: antibiotic biosynthesis monooxygenase family protein [Roseomonadaceae]|uniref:Antibiotic biosynthesis monooxygenase n=1 Tax=Falsiroseomonas oleicola TaxID=2801474 RepID=A0ABS6HE66_9PROT|nr:antibiotic biosynthesis monooxygenase [Roseomonas oleicola]MBU8546636.1 antibiotic biosynthesis monooxygenase [Roseomonas oleicola]